MKFKPKSEEELKKDELCPEGIHPFTVLECADAFVKQGRYQNEPMFKLKINVQTDHGDFHVYDNVSPAFMAFKLRHLAYTIGMGKAYEFGDLESQDIRGRDGYASITQKKDNNGELRSVVKDYIAEHKGATPEHPTRVKVKNEDPAPVDNTDDVPF